MNMGEVDLDVCYDISLDTKNQSCRYANRSDIMQNQWRAGVGGPWTHGGSSRVLLKARRLLLTLVGLHRVKSD